MMKTPDFLKVLPTIGMLVLAGATLSQETEAVPDPVLRSLQPRLEQELAGLKPAVQFEIPDGSGGKSLVGRYQTRNYLVYASNKAGRLSREPAEREGPDDEGFLLQVHVQEKGEVNQAVVPQTLRRPYWNTDLDVYPAGDGTNQLYVALSYRGRSDKDVLAKIKRLIGGDGGHQSGPDPQETVPPDWWSTITETLSWTAVAEEGDALLRVELEKPEHESLEEVKDSEGSVTGYLLGGETLPERFWPGCTLLRKFELEWEGKKMEIPRRFWADLAGFRIEDSPLKVDELPEDQQWEGEQFLDGLQRPRVYLSADEGTLLIEWRRSEECDGHSTIRWTISKAGTILRHRHTPPHEC